MSINSNSVQHASLGGYGGDYVDDTSAHTPPTGLKITCIIPTEEITLTTVGNIAMTTETFPSNYAVYGKYTSITLGKGAAMIYYGV